MPNAGSLAGCRILVIEDDFLVGQVILDILEDEGAEVLGPIGAVDEAVAFIADQATTFDHVVSNHTWSLMNWRGETFHSSSLPVTTKMLSMRRIAITRTAQSQ